MLAPDDRAGPHGAVIHGADVARTARAAGVVVAAAVADAGPRNPVFVTAAVVAAADAARRGLLARRRAAR